MHAGQVASCLLRPKHGDRVTKQPPLCSEHRADAAFTAGGAVDLFFVLIGCQRVAMDGLSTWDAELSEVQSRSVGKHEVRAFNGGQLLRWIDVQ